MIQLSFILPGSFKQTSYYEISPLDHYLCECKDILTILIFITCTNLSKYNLWLHKKHIRGRSGQPQYNSKHNLSLFQSQIWSFNYILTIYYVYSNILVCLILCNMGAESLHIGYLILTFFFFKPRLYIPPLLISTTPIPFLSISCMRVFPRYLSAPNINGEIFGGKIAWLYTYFPTLGLKHGLVFITNWKSRLITRRSH